MSDVAMRGEEPEWVGLVSPEVRDAVRRQTMEGFLQMIKVLEPYATGVMGEISPKMAELHMGALRQFGLLGGAYTHPPVREPVKEAEVIEVTAEDSRLLGAKVLRDLENLEQEMRKDGRL